jgi:mRNA interferase MazF
MSQFAEDLLRPHVVDTSLRVRLSGLVARRSVPSSLGKARAATSPCRCWACHRSGEPKGVWNVRSHKNNKAATAVIVSNDAANPESVTVVVVPVTSNTGHLYPGEAVVTVGRNSKAMADQIMAADKGYASKTGCVLSKADMLAVGRHQGF